LGIGLLIVISALDSLLASVIPQQIIGLLGLVPISIGIIRLVQLRKHESSVQEHMNEQVTSKWDNHISMLTVAAVTFSNGSDKIGIYTPLFAKYSWVGEVVLITLIFLVMTAIWCIVAYYLVRHPFYCKTSS
jgi:cadmium resistance protein CadD (predicted permease)